MRSRLAGLSTRGGGRRRPRPAARRLEALLLQAPLLHFELAPAAATLRLQLADPGPQAGGLRDTPRRDLLQPLDGSLRARQTTPQPRHEPGLAPLPPSCASRCPPFPSCSREDLVPIVIVVIEVLFVVAAPTISTLAALSFWTPHAAPARWPALAPLPLRFPPQPLQHLLLLKTPPRHHRRVNRRGAPRTRPRPCLPAPAVSPPGPAPRPGP